MENKLPIREDGVANANAWYSMINKRVIYGIYLIFFYYNNIISHIVSSLREYSYPHNTVRSTTARKDTDTITNRWIYKFERQRWVGHENKQKEEELSTLCGVCGWKRMNEWMNEWMSEWVSKWVNEWVKRESHLHHVEWGVCVPAVEETHRRVVDTALSWWWSWVDSIQFDSIWFDSIRFDLSWVDLIQFDLIWFEE